MTNQREFAHNILKEEKKNLLLGHSFGEKLLTFVDTRPPVR